MSLSAARECPVGAVRVMAQYTAQGNVLSDELEYLQAYEDVLEKYKGSVSGGFFSLVVVVVLGVAGGGETV